MGGLCTSDTQPATSSQTVIQGTQIPEWVSKGGQELFGQAKNLAQQEYPAYGGARVAPASADETSSQALLRGNLGAYIPYVENAGALTARSGKQWSGDVADEYMNPYQKNVTDIAADELRRNAAIERKDLGAASSAFGAFGSARHGVLEAENERNLGQQISDLYAKGQAAAYEDASTKFNADRSAALSAGQQYGALGSLRSTLGYTDADTLMASGEKQRALTQQSLDTAYNDFLQQREWPYRQVNFATGTLSGVPYEQSTTSTTTGTTPVQQPSVLGQVAGLGLTGAALGNLAGWWG